NCFRFVELLHGEQGMSCFFAERTKEASVIGCSMMIDVVCAECDASEALEEVVFFVGSAVRADEADRICAVGVADGFEFCSGSLRSFFPRDGKQLIALANERLLDALGMLREVEAEAAFDAEEVAVDTAHVAIIGSNNFVIADAERGFAAVRTMRANCRD